MTGNEHIEVVPSAKRLMRSLRDVGYDFVHAVADLVDNSISAGAKSICIQMEFDGSDSWVRIADDGTGMSGYEITEAMRFGSERDYGAEDLGRFGLGLKTASLSQCTKISVASRTGKRDSTVEGRLWDLSHVEATNKWQVLKLSHSNMDNRLSQPLEHSRGTVVLWEQIDRALGYKVLWGERAKKGFLKLTDDLYHHLAMVFNRFLSGEAYKSRKIGIALNGLNIHPWDPFARNETGTKVLERHEFEVFGDRGLGTVLYEPYVLPPQKSFSSPAAFADSGGPRRWNAQQGLYVYRADRLIQSGGWCQMRAADEHTKLARAAVHFRPDLDTAFHLNVSKARVNLPADLRAKLQLPLELLAKEALRAYTPETRRTPSPTNQQHAVTPSPRPTSEKSSIRPPRSGTPAHSHGGKGSAIPAHEISAALQDAAKTVHEEDALQVIMNEVLLTRPDVAKQLGW